MKRNSTALFLLTALILVIAFSSFSKEKKKKVLFPGYTPVESGSYFLLHKKGAGLILPDSGGVIFAKIKFKTDRDSVFVDINRNSRNPSILVGIISPKYKGDFMDLMRRMHAGDSASFFVRMDSLKKYYPREFTFEPKFDTLKYLGFAVQIDSILSKSKVDELRTKAAMEEAAQQMKQQKAMAIMKPIQDSARAKEPGLRENDFALLSEYIKKEWKGPRNPDMDGIFYQEVKTGSGPNVTPGMFISIRYTGKYLDGTIFDSNLISPDQELLTFRYGVDQMIEGFSICIGKMRVGSKAVFVLPPRLGYKDGLTRIFEVEIVSVK
ncbi:MAG: FKBP-type peptidyl-prolyl cis-trans isomerase [Bacteroidota bacterium]|nr:FKBP-type peptidyl-prolyl cis-trans isomerase [Bacteroidota bacterium]